MARPQFGPHPGSSLSGGSPVPHVLQPSHMALDAPFLLTPPAVNGRVPFRGVTTVVLLWGLGSGLNGGPGEPDAHLSPDGSRRPGGIPRGAAEDPKGPAWTE